MTLLSYAVIGAITVFLIWPLLSPFAELIGNRLAPLPFPLAHVIVGCAVAVVFISVSQMYTCRWRHIFRLRYPWRSERGFDGLGGHGGVFRFVRFEYRGGDMGGYVVRPDHHATKPRCH